ncbi:MAG: sensor histidine kinase [Candidatus Binatia bacterium]
MTPADPSENLGADKKYTITILQWLIAIVTSFLVLFPRGEVSEDPWVYALVVVFLISALIPYRLPEGTFHHRFFDFGLLLCDTLLLSSAIYVNRDVSWDLFLFYFFVVFLAAVGENMLRIVLGSVIIGLIYVGLQIQQGTELAQLGSEVFVRITFLFGVAILYGYLAENANRERRRAETAEQRERLRMDLVSALAHDIKNPLGIIMGYTELKLEEADGRSEGRGEKEIWARIQENARRIVNLVTGFLEASRAEKGRLEIEGRLVQVNRLLKEAARQQEAAVQRKGLTLVLELDEGLPEVPGDEAQLDRVFWNLIGNAIKFTRNEGKIKVSSKRENGSICVAVQDTGIGISEEELPFLFSQFRQLKGSARIEGTGLGLFIVKTIVEAHKGTVRAESVEGEGSTFIVRLPIRSSTRAL